LAGRRHIGEALDEFAPSAANGFAIQSGHEGEGRVGGLVRVAGEHANIPATLRVGEAREKEGHLLVALAQVGVGSRLARETLALMDSTFGVWAHHRVSSSQETEYIIGFGELVHL
jgi:hypothetical protein